MVEGLERGPLGAAVEGPSLHGRRRVRHRPDVGHARRRHATAARPDGVWPPAPEPSGAELVVRTLARPHARARPSSCAALRGGDAGPAPVARASARDRARAAVGWPASLRPVARLLAERPDRPAPRVELGRTCASATSRPCAPRSAARSTTSCSTVLTRGFRDLLEARGERVDDRVVRTLVPVSVRRPGERGVYNNRVSAMFAELPVGIDDPVERLARSATQMDGLKESKQAVAGDVLTSLSGFAPPMLLALGTRLRRALPAAQREHGHDQRARPAAARCTRCGRRMLESFPFVPLVGHVRIGDRDLLLRRRPQLRRHRRLRQRAATSTSSPAASSGRWRGCSRP